MLGSTADPTLLFSLLQRFDNSVMKSTSIPRPLMACLVYALPILVVMFAVTSAGYLIVSGGNDRQAESALRYVGIALLMVLATDILLLVGALGLASIAEGDASSESNRRNDGDVSSSN